MASSKYNRHRRHLEYMMLPDLVGAGGGSGGGGGMFSEFDEKFTKLFQDIANTKSTLSRDNIEQLAKHFLKIDLYLRS